MKKIVIFFTTFFVLAFSSLTWAGNPNAYPTTTLAATNITKTSATLNASIVNPLVNWKVYQFFYFGTTNPPSTEYAATPEFIPANTPGTFSFSLDLTSLTCNTTYYYYGYSDDTDGDTGSGSIQSFNTLSCIDPPTVTSVGPASGSTLGGTSIILTGTNFTNASAVTVGGNACLNVVVLNDTTITCTTPPGTAGTASVVVTTPGGSNTANTLYNYILMINGACGSANGVAALMEPVSGLCSAGTPDSVSANNGAFSWNCAGIGPNTTSAACSAPGASSSANDTATFEVVSDNCTVGSVTRQPSPNGGPAGVTMPFGVVYFELVGCSGSSVTLRSTFSGSVEGMQFWKYINASWRTVPSASIAGNTVTWVIDDNGPLDADPAVGAISDPAGPGLGAGISGNSVPNTIPTLSEWGLIGLIFLVMLLGMPALRRRQ